MRFLLVFLFANISALGEGVQVLDTTGEVAQGKGPSSKNEIFIETTKGPDARISLRCDSRTTLAYMLLQSLFGASHSILEMGNFETPDCYGKLASIISDVQQKKSIRVRFLNANGIGPITSIETFVSACPAGTYDLGGSCSKEVTVMHDPTRLPWPFSKQ